MAQRNPVTRPPVAQCGGLAAGTQTANIDPKSKAKRRSYDFARNRQTVFWDCEPIPANRPRNHSQTQLAMGSLGPQPLGKFALPAGSPGERKSPQRLSCNKIRRRAQLFRGKAQEPPLQGRRQCCQPGGINR